jgi:hypothetical protein
MQIRIEKISEDKLSRIVWGFYFSCDVGNMKFILDEFRSQCRETIRKRTWQDKMVYSRVNYTRSFSLGVKMEAGEVPLTDEIIAEVKAQLIGKIQALSVERDSR